jgi:ribosomal protein S27E
MNPQTQFCHNPVCCARGQMGQGNIVVHSHVEQRYRCQACGHTFAATTGTPFYRVHTAAGDGHGWYWSQGCSWARWSSGTSGGAS